MVRACLTAGVLGVSLTAEPIQVPSSAVEGHSVASAQSRGQARRPPARMRFEVMDRDGDGEITRDEWRGSARSFVVHDWNGDGRLSGDEVRLGGRRAAGDMEQADHTPSQAERSVPWTARGFATIDHDRNRRITPDEWHYEHEAFLRADRNRDGALDVREFVGADADDDRDDRFDDLDADGDGRVDRREWHASDDAFEWLDRNRDGVLSRQEVVGTPGDGQSGDEFRSVDSNGDGRIARGEWHESPARFRQLDRNGDGWLSRSEYTSADDADRADDRQSSRVQVDSRQRWTDTFIDVRAGDQLAVSARGSIQMSNDPNDTATPQGSRTGRGAQDAPVRASAGALIARFGNSPPMLVGDQQSLTAPQSGRLYLGVNDDHLDDNRGHYEVDIAVRTGNGRFRPR